MHATACAQCVAHLGIHIGDSGRPSRTTMSTSSDRAGIVIAITKTGKTTVNTRASLSSLSTQLGGYVDEWRDTDDSVLAFGRIPPAGGELLPAALGGSLRTISG